MLATREAARPPRRSPALAQRRGQRQRRRQLGMLSRALRGLETTSSCPGGPGVSAAMAEATFPMLLARVMNLRGGLCWQS